MSEQINKTTHIGESLMHYMGKEPQNVIELIGMGTVNHAMGGGFTPGSLNIVVASSGFGKTNFLVDVANKTAKKTPILFFSCELSKDKLLERFLASALNINFNKINKLRTDSSLINEFASVVKDYSANYKIHLSEETYIEKMVEEAIYQNHLGNCSMIIIDHLGEVNTQKQFINPNEKFTYICDLLYKLYRENNITVLTAAQFKKCANPMDDYGKRGMDDIMGGSVLRSRASLIMYLYCTYKEFQDNILMEEKYHYNSTTCHLKLLKAREGWNNWTTKMYYNKPQVQFKLIPNVNYVPDTKD